MKIVIVLLLAAVLVYANGSEYLSCLRKCKTQIQQQGKVSFGGCFKKCASFRNSTSPSKVMSDAAELTNQMDSSALWDRYRDALFHFIRRGNKDAVADGLQLVTEPLDANWHTYEKHLDLVANAVSEYGSLYKKTERTIPRQYEFFLANIDAIRPEAPLQVKQGFDAVKRDLNKISEELEDASVKCSDDYDNLVNAGVTYAYPQFEKDFCPNIQDIAFRQMLIKGRLTEFKTAVAGPFADVYSALDSYAADKDRSWTDNKSLARFVQAAIAGTADKVTIDMTSSTSVKETRTWYKKKKSGFLFFKKSSSASKTEVRFNSESFTMSVSAQGFGAIQVNPKGSWINTALISKYKSPNYWKDKTMSFFGDNGNFPVFPVTYYVMYKPQVQLVVGKEDGYFFEQNQKSSFSFGPFQSGKGSQMKVQKINNDNYKVEFNTNADDPQIVAVEVAIF